MVGLCVQEGDPVANTVVVLPHHVKIAVVLPHPVGDQRERRTPRRVGCGLVRPAGRVSPELGGARECRMLRTRTAGEADVGYDVGDLLVLLVVFHQVEPVRIEAVVAMQGCISPAHTHHK